MKRTLFVASVTALALAVTGCTATPDVDSDAGPPRIDHVHGIAADPRGDDLLVATHNGIFTLSPAGEVSGPLGGYDFDAMGFTIADTTLFASGHPGPRTPTELGSPNLGILRSDDVGKSWSPIAFTGTEDFHVLTAGPDGTLYGIGSSSADLLVSTDDGVTWARAGASIPAADIVATDTGIYAAVEAGLHVSADGGASFTPVQDAPVLYSLDARPDGTLIGAGIDSELWSQNPDGTWEPLDSLTGFAQALALVGEGRIAVVDDRGIVEITADGSTVLRPAK